jgi:hypothetical protein
VDILITSLKGNKMKTISTKRIGDGKLPNRYWLGISNDYYYYNKEINGMDWISDLNKFEVKSNTIAVFDTYKAAKQAAGEIPVGIVIDGIKANSIFIEDRLSGELYHRTQNFDFENGTIYESYIEDTKYTKQAMAEKNVTFA